MPKTRAQENRAIRQEALRDQLEAQGHVQHVFDIIEEARDLTKKLQPNDLSRYKFVVETKLKLINKYLPDLKQSEISATLQGDITHQLIQLEVIGTDKSKTS